jgi:hypothetical protein
MNKIKLPSMVECLEIQQENSLQSATDFKKYALKFANFLSQEPNIGMVVAAVFEDGEWRVLRTPIEHNPMYWSKEYTTALDNVIFEGFEVDFKTSNITAISNVVYNIWFYKNGIVTINSQVLNTIEQLTPYNLTLTPKFSKELGLI